MSYRENEIHSSLWFKLTCDNKSVIGWRSRAQLHQPHIAEFSILSMQRAVNNCYLHGFASIPLHFSSTNWRNGYGRGQYRCLWQRWRSCQSASMADTGNILGIHPGLALQPFCNRVLLRFGLQEGISIFLPVPLQRNMVNLNSSLWMKYATITIIFK